MSADLAPQLAAFLFETPSVLGRGPRDLVADIVARWPSATVQEVFRATQIAQELLNVRLLEKKTERDVVIEFSLLRYGPLAAAELAAKGLPAP